MKMSTCLPKEEMVGSPLVDSCRPPVDQWMKAICGGHGVRPALRNYVEMNDNNNNVCMMYLPRCQRLPLCDNAQLCWSSPSRLTNASTCSLADVLATPNIKLVPNKRLDTNIWWHHIHRPSVAIPVYDLVYCHFKVGSLNIINCD